MINQEKIDTLNKIIYTLDETREVLNNITWDIGFMQENFGFEGDVNLEDMGVNIVDSLKSFRDKLQEQLTIEEEKDEIEEE